MTDSIALSERKPISVDRSQSKLFELAPPVGQRLPTPPAASPPGNAALGGAIKRLFDIVGAAALLLVAFPLLAFVAIALKINDRGPVLFAQERVGANGRRFRCLKFRTMVVDAEARLHDLIARDPEAAEEWRQTQKLREDPRITRIGKVLRETSLDELPQLWNVLVGEMSLVGPRPIVPSEVSRYGAAFEAYAAVRPGISGLWQVSGRSDCSYEERIDLDVRYVSTWSFTSDVRIALRTVYVVFARQGSC